MSTLRSLLFLVLSTFLACAVEAVEALTVVLAVGVTRGWRSALVATAAATLSLVAIVAVFGPALGRVPLETLRVVVGTLLLIFGLGWLRKAILRAGGVKPLRDENALYRKRVAEAGRATSDAVTGLDWAAFTIVFKSVFLEGLEVAFIVLTFGTTQHSLTAAALGAALAIVVVVGIGVSVRAPLSRVPENTMKLVVGLMLTTFGIFWSVEGTGVHWPGEDLAIPAILAFLAAATFALIGILRRVRALRSSL